jgi:hypothetical protein
MEEFGKMHGMEGTHGEACGCVCHGMGGEKCHMCQKMHGRGPPNPLDMSVKMWKKAFFEALMEVHKDALKKKMEAEWGPMTEKAAQAVMDSMTKMWIGLGQVAGAEMELR